MQSPPGLPRHRMIQISSATTVIPTARTAGRAMNHGKCKVQTMIFGTGCWLPCPSEKWWSSSVGMILPKYGKKKGSKPPTRWPLGIWDTTWYNLRIPDMYHWHIMYTNLQGNPWSWTLWLSITFQDELRVFIATNVKRVMDGCSCPNSCGFHEPTMFFSYWFCKPIL